jgi:type IV pilus assembly protein PilQ
VQEFTQGNVRSARIVESEDRTRVVLNLREIAPYQVRQSSEAVLVIVQPPGSAVAPAAPAAAPVAPMAPMAPMVNAAGDAPASGASTSPAPR